METTYLSRYTKDDIEALASANVSPDVANAYTLQGQDRLRGAKTIKLVRANVPAAKANVFAERFSIDDVVALKDVDPTVANAFDRKFSAKQIATLVTNCDCVADKANKYTCPPQEAVALVKAKITPETAEKYLPRERNKRSSSFWGTAPSMSGQVIVAIESAGGNFEIANSYDKRFDSQEVLTFIRQDIVPTTANAFPAFDGADIVRLIKSGYTAARVAEFKDFGPESLLVFKDEGIGASYANTARQLIDSHYGRNGLRSDQVKDQILLLKKMGIGLKRLEKLAQKFAK